MITVNATNFRKDMYKMMEQTATFGDPVQITTKTGNLVLLSEQDYNNMMETLYLMSIPGKEEEIVEGMNTPLEDCVPADEVVW